MTKEDYCKYHPLENELAGQVYLFMINFIAKSQTDPTEGTNRIDPYAISAILDHMVWAMESRIAQPGEFDIATTLYKSIPNVTTN